MKHPRLALPSLLLPLLASGELHQDRPVGDRVVLQDVREQLTELLVRNGIVLDQPAGLCAIPAAVDITNDLLEYLLVNRHGAAHESLFTTEVDAELLNAALLALGVAPGKNAVWTPKDPPPSEEELRHGHSPYDVHVPEGDGFYLYAAWREGDELYFHRVEDLIRDLATRRTMRRHRWVYLGSRMVRGERDQNERFAAAIEGNLINISFFSGGNTLVTAGLEACVEQTIWLANAWLLPGFQSPVLLLFSRERLESLPESLAARVPSALAEDHEGEREH